MGSAGCTAGFSCKTHHTLSPFLLFLLLLLPTHCIFVSEQTQHAHNLTFHPTPHWSAHTKPSRTVRSSSLCSAGWPPKVHTPVSHNRLHSRLSSLVTAPRPSLHALCSQPTFSAPKLTLSQYPKNPSLGLWKSSFGLWKQEKRLLG